jgi:trimethylamine--corrinoid protein Co-methyltransferase
MNLTTSREYERFNRLSLEQGDKIHAASLEILERIGVRIYLDEAIELLRKGGGTVEDGNLVRIPAGRVEWALASAPKQVALFSRQGAPAILLGDGRCFYGPGSDCLNIIDHRGGERRKPVLQDVVEGARLCDALANIDFVMSMVLPTDVDQTLADVYQMQAMLENSAKPIVYVSYEAGGLVNAVEMAEAVVGGAEALERNPILTCYINVVSGSVHNESGLRKLLYLARKGLPALYIPGSNAGVTSPMTMAGATALDLAGGLAGLTVAQLAREGAPYIMSAMDPAALDMRTMVSPYGYPERGIIRSLAKRYGLPSFSLAGGSDAKSVDQQAAAEAALTLLADTLMGGNLIHDLGYLESGLTFSFAQLVICNEIVSWIKGFLSPVDVSDEALAMDVIEQVGAHGQYLKTDHTLRHFRDHWYPAVFERGTFQDWTQKGSLNLGERAANRVQKILAEHQAEPLPEEVRRRLDEIVRRAESVK